MPIVARILTLSVVVGVITGLAISLYVLATRWLAEFLFLGRSLDTLTSLPVWYLYLVPTAAIFIVNWLIDKDPAVREYGVTEIANTVTGNKEFITLKGLVLKIVASILSLGSGFTVGNEGPSAAIGAMIAYKTNQLFKVPERFVRLIISIGASSGIAAVFVSPITGIVFAIENIAYEFVQRLIGPIILAAIIAFGIAYQFIEPIVFRYSVGHVFQVGYVAATLLFIPVILFFLFIYLTLKNHIFNRFNHAVLNRYGKWRNPIFAILGGLTVGTMLTFAPFTVFSGHEVVTALINDKLHISVVLITIVVFLRILTTVVSIYSNAVGGLFLPLMSIGALIGYGYAEVFGYYGFHVEPYSFAAIGAAVFMGVVMRLPLTAIVLALEITYDYSVIVPTGVAVILATYFANLNFNIRKLKATEIKVSIEEKECQYGKEIKEK
ncbi:chloride channel protein [Hydrogenimonas sp.]|uniref:chloride channel protein n=1 Tax=Hydrogenimonas sp. TaxID=2231112 RepID=UPI002620D720|nr:chloride channel protein [Hydrogenimonas sp.]